MAVSHWWVVSLFDLSSWQAFFKKPRQKYLKSLKANSKVGTHTSPSIHKFLYTPTVRSQTKPQPTSLRDQQGASLRNQLNDIADVERKHIMSHLSNQQEMDFRWLSKRSFFDLISQIFSGCLTMARSHHWSQTGLSSQRKPSSPSTM